ncbi:ATP-binding protein [uncultured Flavonifractor sp.]|uniref:ATP-binding protein n=1 Tax=uncultured Flavonifractor sp. TaxID=1193534 RepID=UPI0026057D66|nr:ATP-binding protein [uncultured Flavonifractor sp.]
MGQSIVQIKQMGDALRSSGYKSIDSAIAELIDNSIEAGAHDIFVIMTERVDPVSHRKAVYEFGILDNGSGMDISKLASCLGIGFTTKSDRRGMGRFGVGLPQASLHVTPNVEVYSWTQDDGPIEVDDPVRQVWLDIEKVKTGEQEEINDPELTEIPKQYRPFLNYHTSGKTYDFTAHGTLVYWKNCDNVKPKTMATLNEKLEFFLGRKFRHLIMNGTHNIRLITIGHEDAAIDVLPNDPLFLMKPNYVLGNLNDPANISERANINCTEPIFEPYGDNDGEVIIQIPYVDKKTGEEKTSDVLIRFSKVRAEFYDQTAISTGDPGNKPIGKYAKKLEGISVVRAGREIDFGAFDFYDKTNNPYHRWWGCEILFDPVLDEVFGVSNNKQQVELRDDAEPEVGPNNELILPLWNRLAQIIKYTIKEMVEDNKELRKGSRIANNDEIGDSPANSIVSAVEDNEDDTGSATSKVTETTDPEVLEKEAEEFLKDHGFESPTYEQIRALLNRELTFEYTNLGRNGSFIDTDFSLGHVKVTINTAHIFYNEYIVKMPEESRLAFELFIAALAKAIDLTNIHNSDQNDELLQHWDHRLKSYLKQIKSN